MVAGTGKDNVVWQPTHSFTLVLLTLKRLAFSNRKLSTYVLFTLRAVAAAAAAAAAVVVVVVF